MAYYETLKTGGPCDGKKRIYVHLYSNTSNEDGDVNNGGIVPDSIIDALGQLVTAGSVDYYEVLRFKTESYGHPKIDEVNVDTETKFRNWLQDGSANNTNSDLYSIIGVHHLVESFSCDTSGNGAEAASCGGLALSAGVVSWSSVYCADDIARNAAIQEPVHLMIDTSLADDLTGPDGDEHTLGKINFYNDATPMLTFHEGEAAHKGSCQTSYDWGFTYTQDLTSCTEQAVKDTGTICSGQDAC